VDIRLPDLGALVAGERVPDHLRTAAVQKLLGEINPSAVDEGETAGQSQAKQLEETLPLALQFNDWVVSEMLVDPVMSMQDLAMDSDTRPPEEDMEMLVQIAMRERDRDARGVRLGVEPLSRMERFRHWHKCPPDCPACVEYGREVSTRGLGAL
jgi:hypothetical protein